MSNWNLDNLLARRARKSIYRDGDCMIKLFDEDFTKSDILNEALNQSRIEEALAVTDGVSFKVPKIVEVTRIGGKWAIVAEFIEGKTLGELMAENPGRKDEYLSFYVNLQMEMHAQKVPLLSKLRDKMNRKISQASLDADVRYDLQMRLDSMPRHTKLCHGDYSPNNIIMTKDGTPYIIDWAHATQGNASADVARSYLLFCLKDDSPAAEQYMELFCKKSETLRRYIESWLPIVAASQSVKGHENELPLLRHWIGVFDYE